MKLKVASLAGGALLLVSTMAVADTIISTEQETLIREEVTGQAVASVEIPADVTIEVGTVIPETVELMTLDVPEVETQYSYVMVEERIVLVEPETREIVHIIQ